MKANVYNQKGEETGTVVLPKDIFEVKINPDVIYEVAVSQASNRRKPIAHTKGRGEVRGGGKKPWRQKGTGRARHGSIRSPLWKGGGTTFGPTKNKDYKKKINEKVKRIALFMVLSAKAKDNLLTVLDEIKFEAPKTKAMEAIIKALSLKGSVLVALPKTEKNVFLATRNITGVKAIEAKNLNALDLLTFKNLIMGKEAIKTIKETFQK
jgi:large subunit ribosomal protein L4